MNRDTTMPRVAALAVLRLQAGATRDEVKAAYRAAVKRTHPDAGGTAGAFIEVKRAFDSLVRHGTGSPAVMPPPPPAGPFGVPASAYAAFQEALIEEMARAFYIPAGQFRLGGNYKCHVTLKGWDFINHRERTEGDKKP